MNDRSAALKSSSNSSVSNLCDVSSLPCLSHDVPCDGPSQSDKPKHLSELVASGEQSANLPSTPMEEVARLREFAFRMKVRTAHGKVRVALVGTAPLRQRALCSTQLWSV